MNSESANTINSSSIKIGICGFGTVGGGSYNLLQNAGDEISRRVGCSIDVVRIASRSLKLEDIDTTASISNDPFDVVNDPLEENDLMAGAGFTDLADQLEAKLRRIVDPEAAEEQAKADQRAKIADLGGTDVVKNAGVFFRLTHSGQGSGDRKTGLARPAVQRS